MVQSIQQLGVAGLEQTADECQLSFGEEAIWLHERLRFQDNNRCMVVSVALEGELEVEALQGALANLIDAQPNLRSNYIGRRGKPVRIVQRRASVPLEVEDLSGLDPAQQATAHEAAVQAVATTPFLLSKGALLRAQLQRLGPNSHRLLLSAHQIVLDDGSVPLLIEQLAAHYRALRADSAAPSRSSVSYAQFAERQRGDAEATAKSEAYWRKKLGSVSSLGLPYVRARASSSITRKGSLSSSVSAETLTQARGLANECGVEASAIFLGVLATLLHRYTGQPVLHLGALTNTRTNSELKDVIGFFGALLPVCIDMKGAPSFYDVAGHVSDLLGDARRQGNVSPQIFDELLRKQAEAPFPPPFQVIFEYREDRLRPVDAAGLVFKPSQRVDNQLAAFDIALSAIETGGQIEVVWEYNADLLAAETMRQLDRHFHHLLLGALAKPHTVAAELPLRSDAEAQAWLERQAPKAPPPPPDFAALAPNRESSLVSLFEARVEARPTALALECGELRLSYAELDARANGVAAALLAAGAGEGRCGLLLPQSELPVIAALGVMKARSAYVPLDATMPVPRLAQIAADAELSAIITDAAGLGTAAEILATCPNKTLIDIGTIAPSTARPSVEARDPDEAAYILYTSGSTGTPKGVVQSHRNACYHACVWANRLRISASDRVSLIPTFAWDSAFQDTFGALLSGAALLPFDLRASGIRTLLEWLEERRVSVVHMVVPLFREVARAAAKSGRFDSVRMLALGGDLIFEEDVLLFGEKFPEACWLANAYGSTESSSGLMNFFQKGDVLDASSFSLGFPPPESEVTLLNAAGEQCAVYGIGEIVFRSPYLAVGYYGDQDLSLNKFETLPNKPRYRQLRTGDLGRLLPTGSVQYLGRKDFQVKIRGYRVELGEIEAALASHPEVAEAVVQAFEDGARSKALVAFVRPKRQVDALEASLREHLRARLPEYMVPGQLSVVDQIPRTATGKIDRKSLKAPTVEARVLDPARDDPRTPTERNLRELWAQVLEVKPETISREHDFFEIGGHSIVAMALLARMYEVGLLPADLQEDRSRLLFEKATLGAMAQWIDESQSERPNAENPTQQG